MGTAIKLNVGNAEVAGAFAGLADDGKLLLHTGGQVSAFAAGEIVPQQRG